MRRLLPAGHCILVELLMFRLPELVGSPLSINALREDLQVSHKAAAAWLGALERLFAIFRLAPVGLPRIRAVKKEQKHWHSRRPGPCAARNSRVTRHRRCAHPRPRSVPTPRWSNTR